MSFGWLFLDLNSFFASVEQAEDPRLRGKPVAVVPMIADSTSCIAASYEAKAFGVKTGTKVRDAKALCPNIIFIQAGHKKYISYHKRVIEAVEHCYPVSSIMSIDEMACALTGRHQREEHAIALAYQIKQSIYTRVSTALSCSVGVAPNRYLAKVASDMQKPNGLTLIKKEQIPDVFFPLKITDFPGIGPRMERRLHSYGCTTVQKLYRLTSLEMKEIWGGVLGEDFWKLIRGEDVPSRITGTHKTIGHSRIIAPDHRGDREFIKCIVMQLVTKACVRLRDASLFAKSIYFFVRFLEPAEKEFGIVKRWEKSAWDSYVNFDETQNTLFIASELEKMLQKLPQGNVYKVGIVLSNLVHEEYHQPSLFEDKRAKPLMSAVDTINKKYHKNVVFPASANLSEDRTSARIAFARIPDEDE